MALALGAVGDPEGVQLGILQAKPDSHHLRPRSLLSLSIPVQFPAGAVLAAQGAAFRTGIARQRMSFRIQQFRPQLTLAAIRVNKEMIACIGQFFRQQCTVAVFCHHRGKTVPAQSGNAHRTAGIFVAAKMR